jgi:hypothetical protein
VTEPQDDELCLQMDIVVLAGGIHGDDEDGYQDKVSTIATRAVV